MDHREHITILFTDMVGSTERYVNLSLGTADDVRRRHFSLLRQAIESSGGHEVKSLGDGVMVALPSAPAALECAVTMQQAVELGNRAGGSDVGLRVGASCGEVTHEINDYFGPAVIEASRLCARAESGQILVADSLRTVAGLRNPHSFHRHSGLELKGFNETVTAYEVKWEPLER